MNDNTEPEFCARCMQTDEECRCYAATLTPWHVYTATAESVGREPIATFATRANAHAWCDREWSPNLPNDATYIIARTYRTATKIARDLYGN